jgi:apolipoprotein N-acyltransferase
MVTGAGADFAARLLPPATRALVAALTGIAGASLPAILALVLIATDPPIGIVVLVQLVALFAALPAAAAHLIRRAGAARLELGGADLVVRRADLLMEIPHGAIAQIVPWTVPLPASGLVLRMRSGNRLRDGIELDDPAPLLDALARAGVAPAESARAHPSVVYAHAAASEPPWRWYHYAWKFAGFALVPTAVFFNAHQHIAYGGSLGEYYLLGLGAYLRTFALYWATVAIHLVLYAGLWRAFAEPAALLAAWVAPAHARVARRGAEMLCQVAYYAGVPALTALRFLA